MSAALAIIEREEITPSVREINSETLGLFVRDGMIGVATKLVELKPYVEELWRRIDRGEVILGCSTKKEFCQQVLQRTPRAVRYMLDGGNHNRGETVSPPRSRQVSDPEFAAYEREHPTLRQSTTDMLAKGMTRTDVVHALTEMGTPKPMAEGVVRKVSASMPASPKDIQLELCSRTDPRYENLREDHYIENRGCIGEQAHFLIHYRGEIAGIISGASPVYATPSRDKFFGLDKMIKPKRNKFLQGIVNNVVFRLEDHERNLAGRVLRLWRELIPHIWYELYGTVVYGFETFVIETPTRPGTLYIADNWTRTGTTAGNTKVRNGIEKPADTWKEVTPKLVFLPLERWIRCSLLFPHSRMGAKIGR